MQIGAVLEESDQPSLSNAKITSPRTFLSAGQPLDLTTCYKLANSPRTLASVSRPSGIPTESRCQLNRSHLFERNRSGTKTRKCISLQLDQDQNRNVSPVSSRPRADLLQGVHESYSLCSVIDVTYVLDFEAHLAQHTTCIRVHSRIVVKRPQHRPRRRTPEESRLGSA